MSEDPGGIKKRNRELVALVVRLRAQNLALKVEAGAADLLREQAERRLKGWEAAARMRDDQDDEADWALETLRVAMGCDGSQADQLLDAWDAKVAELEATQTAVKSHNAKMAELPRLQGRPSAAAEGLRFLARWFDALYPGDKDRQVQEDLLRWADEAVERNEK